MNFTNDPVRDALKYHDELAEHAKRVANLAEAQLIDSLNNLDEFVSVLENGLLTEYYPMRDSQRKNWSPVMQTKHRNAETVFAFLLTICRMSEAECPQIMRNVRKVLLAELEQAAQDYAETEADK